MSRPLDLVRLEVKRFLAAPGDLAFSLALPIALFVLMLGVFGGESSFNGTAHVVDLDGGAVSHRLLDRLRAVDGLTVELHAEPDLDGDLDRSAVLTGFVIPAGFSRSIESGTPAAITVKRRGNGGDGGQIVASIVGGVMLDLAAEYELRAAIDALVGPDVADDAIDAAARRLHAASQDTPVVTVVGDSDRAPDGGVDIPIRLLPGIIVMFLLFSVTLGAQTLVEERRIGTLERLMTTRLTTDQLFAGKFLAGIGRGMVQVAVLLGLGFVVLRVAGPAAFVQSLGLAVVVAAAVSAIGLVIAAVARSQDQATWGAVLVTMYMTVFGGTFFPVGSSGALHLMSLFTVNRYAIDAFSGIIVDDAGLTGHGTEIAILLGVTVVGLAVARATFRTTPVVR